MRTIKSLIFVSFCLFLSSGAHAYEFSSGNWSGWAADIEGRSGCIVATGIADEVFLAIFADGNETFDLSIMGSRWELLGRGDPKVQVSFDGVPFPLSGASAANNSLLELWAAGAEESGWEGPLKTSNHMNIVVHGTNYHVPLEGSGLAIAELWRCVYERAYAPDLDEEMGFLEPGMHYGQVRLELLKRGWIPYRHPNADPHYDKRRAEYQMPELDTCSGGIGYCSFHFRHPLGAKIEIVTTEDDEFIFKEWHETPER